MKIKINIIIFILFFLFSATYIKAAKEPIAVLIKAKGKVFLVKENQKKGIPAKRGTRILSGQSILTKGKGFAIVKFIDKGSVIRIQPNSYCRFEGKKRKKNLTKNLFLEVGLIFSKVFKNRGDFSVTTPTSVASVKGTAFWTKQEFKGATYYFGEEGVVEISNRRGVALLKAGMTGIVASPNSKPIVRKTRKNEKPQLKDENESYDEFDFEFEDANGNTKSLKFKLRKKNK